MREAMRIQCVPDGYVLPTDMPLSYKFKTIGNGVPVSLARAVARSIVDVIEVERLHKPRPRRCERVANTERESEPQPVAKP